MKTSAHDRIREELKALADSELAPLRRVFIARHVAGCINCQKEMEEMKEITHKLFVSEGASTLSDPLRARLIGTLGDATSRPSNSPERLNSRKTSWIYAATGTVAAASLIAFGVTYMAGWRNHSIADAPHAAATLRIAAVPDAANASIASPKPSAIIDNSSAVVPLSAHDSFKVVSTARRSLAASVPEPRSSSRAPLAAAAMPQGFLAGSGGIGDNDVSKSAPRLAVQPGTMLHIAGRPQFIRVPAPERIDPGMGIQPNGPVGGAYVPPAGAVNVTNAVRAVDNRATLGVEVDDVESAGEKIGEMVKADGGYVATNNLSVESGNRVDRMTVKIPSADFDSMIAAFSRYGTVVSKNVTAEDITDKTDDANSSEQGQIDLVVETEGKLKSGGITERRRAALEEQLAEQRSELAQIRARLGTLRKTAALSTVELTLTEKSTSVSVPTPAPKSDFWSGFGDTGQSATAAFQSAIKVPITAAIWMLALSPIWLPLALLVRYLFRKKPVEDWRDR